MEKIKTIEADLLPSHLIHFQKLSYETFLQANYWLPAGAGSNLF